MPSTRQQRSLPNLPNHTAPAKATHHLRSTVPSNYHDYIEIIYPKMITTCDGFVRVTLSRHQFAILVTSTTPIPSFVPILLSITDLFEVVQVGSPAGDATVRNVVVVLAHSGLHRQVAVPDFVDAAACENSIEMSQKRMVNPT